MTFFTGNFALSFVFGGLLQFIWGMINALQVIMLSTLFNVDIPLNAYMIMEVILKLCALDFFSTE